MSAYQWAIIGAGPAGLATVGKLIDLGVDPATIAWFDPAFTVGDFGTKWRNIPSNTKVGLFKKFLSSCSCFEFDMFKKGSMLMELDDHETCQLSIVADVLQKIGDKLAASVNKFQTNVTQLNYLPGEWQLHADHQKYTAKNVVMAIGSEPKQLFFTGGSVIPLDVAMDCKQLDQAVNEDDIVAVFGSSHSAILAIRNLIEGGRVKKIINFYRSPLRFALDMGDWILYDNTGLKGTTASFAKQDFEQYIPEKIERYYSSEENIEHRLPQCNKIIYAVGFEKRQSIVVEDFGHLSYCDKTGIIATGLFGVGIAFPELKEDCVGLSEYRVGLWKFMDYLNRVVPIWLRYSPSL